MEHPIVNVLRAEGRSVAWLARVIGYSYVHTRHVLHGLQPALPRFRQLCAGAVGRPEAELFREDAA